MGQEARTQWAPTNSPRTFSLFSKPNKQQKRKRKRKLTKSPGYLQFVLVRGSVRDSKKRKQPSSDCDVEIEEAPKRLKLYDLGHVVRV